MSRSDSSGNPPSFRWGSSQQVLALDACGFSETMAKGHGLALLQRGRKPQMPKFMDYMSLTGPAKSPEESARLAVLANELKEVAKGFNVEITLPTSHNQ